jgi:2-iminobutanoate/2-iminopropanoate deaminase
MKKTITQTQKAPQAVGTYSQGVSVAGFHFFSGQIGLDPKTGQLRETFEEQLQQVLDNIDALLEANQLKRDHIVKSTIFMTSLHQFAEVNKAYEHYFSRPYPARSTVEVSALPKGALVEIEILAYRDSH